MAGNWKSLVVCPHRRMAMDLTSLLSQHAPGAPINGQSSYPVRAMLNEMMASHRPNICFLDMVSDQDRALTLISELLALNANLPIVALLPANDPDLILKGLRRGALEFILHPFTGDQLQAVFEQIIKRNPTGAPGGEGKIYTVMPVKGACGASTLAANLALHTRKIGPKRVLLADLDAATGTQSFLLKLKSSYSFLDVLSHAHHLDGDLWKGMVATSHNVDVLLAPESASQGGGLPDPSSIIEYTRKAYDVAVLDTNGVYGEWNLSLARHCDELLLVTTNELPALQATQRALMYLDSERVERSKVRLIVNRFRPEVGLSKEMIGTALQSEVFQVLPSDYEAINRALLEGKAVPAAAPFGRALSELTRELIGKPEAEKKKKEPAKPSGLSSLFSLFNRTKKPLKVEERVEDPVIFSD